MHSKNIQLWLFFLGVALIFLNDPHISVLTDNDISVLEYNKIRKKKDLEIKIEKKCGILKLPPY